MGDYGIKISQPGYSISDLPKRMVFHSGYANFKAFEAISFNLSTTGGWVYYQYSHGLGYVPAFSVSAWAETSSGSGHWYYETLPGFDFGSTTHLRAIANSTYIRVYLFNSWSYEVDGHIYIFADKIA